MCYTSHLHVQTDNERPPQCRLSAQLPPQAATQGEAYHNKEQAQRYHSDKDNDGAHMLSMLVPILPLCLRLGPPKMRLLPLTARVVYAASHIAAAWPPFAPPRSTPAPLVVSGTGLGWVGWWISAGNCILKKTLI